MAPQIGPTGQSRILQVHPTRLCNLRCLHCYSGSGPDQRGELPSALLGAAVVDARDEGYTVVSISGGEPLLYRGLADLLTRAKTAGMRTTVTSNGMLLDERRLQVLRGRVDLLAISLDGVPSSHNRMRGSDNAFESMAGRLEGVRAAGIPFGFIFTLTQYNVHELLWVAHFAAGQGASLLQVHPLEEVGRARVELVGARPDGTEAGVAFLVVERLRAELGDRLHIHLDLAHRSYLRTHPEAGLAGGPDVEWDAGGRTLADVVAPLVIEPDGTVVPVQYGFPRAYALGSLQSAPLRTLAATWRRERSADFRAHCRRVWEANTRPDCEPLFNWYEAVSGADAPISSATGG